MLFAQGQANPISSSPEALQEAAAEVVVQSGADTAAQTAQNVATEAAARLPEYLSWVKQIDMAFAIGLLIVIAILFYTFAKNTVAMTVIGVALAFLIASQTPLLDWIPTIGNIPDYMVHIATFGILSLLIANILFKSTFFEPMNIPTGREVLMFAVVTTGFLIALGLTWWPVAEAQQFSQVFQTVFVNQPMRSIWIVSPVIIMVMLRGKF